MAGSSARALLGTAQAQQLLRRLCCHIAAPLLLGRCLRDGAGVQSEGVVQSEGCRVKLYSYQGCSYSPDAPSSSPKAFHCVSVALLCSSTLFQP